MSEDIEKRWRDLMELWMEIEYRQWREYLDGEVKKKSLSQDIVDKWLKDYLLMVGKDEEWETEVWEGRTTT